MPNGNAMSRYGGQKNVTEDQVEESDSAAMHASQRRQVACCRFRAYRCAREVRRCSGVGEYCSWAR